MADDAVPVERSAPVKPVKCVVWDLDDTLWRGILLEDGEVALRPGAREVIEALDRRGILNSIASRNEPDPALAMVARLGLGEYFLHPQIHWGSKVASLEAIARALDVGLDALAFVDDQPAERGEVSFSLPQVLVLDPADLDRLLDRPELNPPFVTAESRLRRRMYLAQGERQRAEEEFAGPRDAFLATLAMTFTIARASAGDLERAAELTVRTHQLNTTGITYGYEELDGFRRSPQHRLLVASLEDCHGTYGTIGLALVECGDPWSLRLLLMSCRVLSRGVGSVLLGHVMTLARDAGVRLRADFVANGRNRLMYVTYKLAGFRDLGEKDGITTLESDVTEVPPVPSYLRVRILP